MFHNLKRSETKWNPLKGDIYKTLKMRRNYMKILKRDNINIEQ